MMSEPFAKCLYYLAGFFLIVFVPSACNHLVRIDGVDNLFVYFTEFSI